MRSQSGTLGRHGAEGRPTAAPLAHALREPTRQARRDAHRRKSGALRGRKRTQQRAGVPSDDVPDQRAAPRDKHPAAAGVRPERGQPGRRPQQGPTTTAGGTTGAQEAGLLQAGPATPPPRRGDAPDWRGAASGPAGRRACVHFFVLVVFGVGALLSLVAVVSFFLPPFIFRVIAYAPGGCMGIPTKTKK